ncbi:MAG: PcfJ domain-containing protein [Bacteroidia bacterium]|nr:PcfJ domain-containing protein [Bacteroidia bacterium]
MANRQKRIALREQEMKERKEFITLLRESKFRFKQQKEQKEFHRRSYLKARKYIQIGFPDYLATNSYFIQGLGQRILTYKNRFINSLKKFPWEDYKKVAINIGDTHGHFCGDLLKFLFVRYQMPSFMFRAFAEQNTLYMNWFFHLAQGKNLRKCEGLPFPVTKKMAAFFMDGKEQLGILANLRHAQVLGLGGSQFLANMMASSFFGTPHMLNHNPSEEAFIERLILWLAHQEVNDTSEVNEILKYIEQVKFRPQRLLNRNGSYDLLPPPKPGLEVKGRNYNKFLAEARLYNENSCNNNPFPKNNIYNRVGDFSLSQSWKSAYKIVPLLSESQIQEEGAEMRHCVGSYVWSCELGESSIWSMRLIRHAQPPKRLLTICLTKNLEMVEVRGFANRDPKKDELEVLRKWASTEKLRIPNCMNFP